MSATAGQKERRKPYWFALRYFPLDGLPAFIDSVLAIEHAAWRARLVTWLWGAARTRARARFCLWRRSRPRAIGLFSRGRFRLLDCFVFLGGRLHGFLRVARHGSARAPARPLRAATGRPE